MMSLHALLGYAGIYALFIAIPGPGIVSIVARALGSGIRSAAPAIAGVLISHICFITLSVLGLAALAQGLGRGFLVVKIAGGAYLIYLGVRYWHAPVTANFAFRPETAWQSFVSQMTISLGNPKCIAFFAALLPAIVDIRQLEPLAVVQLIGVSAAIMPPILFAYAALAARLRGVLASAAARKRMNRGAGLIMAAAGIGVAVS